MRVKKLKKIKYILPLALIVVLITPMFTHGNFGVEVGDTYTYDCVASERDITLGSNSA